MGESQSAIQTPSEIDQQSKQAGLDQEALNQIARQGFLVAFLKTK
jgi:hypothetical protein